MKRILIGIAVFAVIALALGSAATVFAQSNNPQETVPGYGYGMGMHGNRGGMMGGNFADSETGLLHDQIVAVFADKLGISVDDLNARLENGETLSTIAVSKGLSLTEFQTIMVDARNQAIDLALKDGTLTQQQADWMKSHGFGRQAGGFEGGRGQGQFSNPNCPYNQD